MTIIAYSPGLLVADSRAVTSPENFGEQSLLTTQVRSKIKLLANGRLAAANSGPIMTERNWQELERILLHYCMILEEFEPDHESIAFEDEHASASVFTDRFMLVLTRRHVYVVSRETSNSASKPVGLMRMDPNENFAYGSGANIAYVAFAAGMDAERTAYFVTEQDYLTGPPIEVVRQVQMRPLLSLRVPKAARKAVS